jgi:hypothetical protein
MTEVVREHCRGCKAEADLDERGYIVEHDWMWVGLDPFPDVMLVRRDAVQEEYGAVPRGEGAFRCGGSGKRSIEFRDRNRESKSARIIAAVDRVKLDAEIAFDAWQEGRTDFNYDLMVGIALKEYGRRFPSSTKYKHYVTERLKGGAWSSYKVDVYCTFCRGIVMPHLNAAADPCRLERVVRHTTGCALLCLSGRREWAAPGTRGLIDEDRVFE